MHKFSSLETVQCTKNCCGSCSAQDPFNFDADPDPPDPGSALEKKDPDPGHFFKIY